MQFAGNLKGAISETPMWNGSHSKNQNTKIYIPTEQSHDFNTIGDIQKNTVNTLCSQEQEIYTYREDQMNSKRTDPVI